MYVRVHQRTRAHPARAPSGYSSHGCDARQRERASVREPVHPWTAAGPHIQVNANLSKEHTSEQLLLRQDAAQTGPRKARRRRAGKARRGPRRMRGRSLLYMDVQSANLRSAFAHPQGRMPGGRAFRGVLSLVTFFAQAKKVTRSPAGRVEALLFGGRSRWIPAFAGMTRRSNGSNPLGNGPSGSSSL